VLIRAASLFLIRSEHFNAPNMNKQRQREATPRNAAKGKLISVILLEGNMNERAHLEDTRREAAVMPFIIVPARRGRFGL